MKPILKWVGGKTQILSQVLEEFPDEIQGDYYEPFVGGASVLLATIPRVCGRVYASDVNPNLIAVYEKIKNEPEKLIRELEELQNDMSEATYYARRQKFNESAEPSLFIYLNKVGFRGLYREGPNGFNVPYGHPKSPPALCDPENVRAVSRAIQNVTFRCESYEQAMERMRPCDFVYADPPYVPETMTSFTGYVRGEFNHVEFFKRLKALKCSWVMSNARVPLVMQEFPGAREIEARRAIHSKNPGARTMEVLVRNRVDM
jgi:DNA adenine methylase